MRPTPNTGMIEPKPGGTLEFKAFPKIERLDKQAMFITQKIHGSNAQVLIYTDETGALNLKTGSRNRWVTPEDDNYGFASFVQDNKAAFIDCLGIGQHFGEWSGPGINSGEGLTEKTFILFDHWKFPADRPLPPQTQVVPVLYRGKLDAAAVDAAMENLKTNGSVLVAGFMRPEGVVVTIGGILYKKVFDAEETAWTKGDGKKERIFTAAQNLDISDLLQPIRLEKLLSKDERYIRDFPASLKQLASDYVADLVTEGQLSSDTDEAKAQTKALGSTLYKFLRLSLENEMSKSHL